MDIGLQYFKGNTICKSNIKKYKMYNNGIFNLADIEKYFKTSCKIHFNRDNGTYTLVPERKQIKNDNIKQIISLDPGLRKLMMGICEK